MRLVLFFALLAASGCRFGEAHFTTSFEGTGFDPGGTVFAYLDERDENLVEDPDPRVVVAMTWIVFDPQSDLNDLDGAALSAMSHEMAVRDTLVLVFPHQGAVDEGEEFTGVRDGDAVSGDVEARVHFAPERLDASSTFEELAPFASRQNVDVEIEDAGFDDAASFVAANVKIEFEAVEGRDIGKAKEGDIDGAFRAPLVEEAVAEANLALLDDDGLLGLPLGARQ